MKVESDWSEFLIESRVNCAKSIKAMFMGVQRWKPTVASTFMRENPRTYCDSGLLPKDSLSERLSVFLALHIRPANSDTQVHKLLHSECLMSLSVIGLSNKHFRSRLSPKVSDRILQADCIFCLSKLSGLNIQTAGKLRLKRSRRCAKNNSNQLPRKLQITAKLDFDSRLNLNLDLNLSKFRHYFVVRYKLALADCND